MDKETIVDVLLQTTWKREIVMIVTINPSSQAETENIPAFQPFSQEYFSTTGVSSFPQWENQHPVLSLPTTNVESMPKVLRIIHIISQNDEYKVLKNQDLCHNLKSKDIILP